MTIHRTFPNLSDAEAQRVRRLLQAQGAIFTESRGSDGKLTIVAMLTDGAPVGSAPPVSAADNGRSAPPITEGPAPATSTPAPPLAWGIKVSPIFRTKLITISDRLSCEPNHLMAAIAFETGRTFSPSIRNPGSTATGLIQFIESTAQSLGTTTAELAQMTAEDQLDFVDKYLQPFAGRLKTLSDIYMAILFPKAVGQPESFVLFSRGTKRYDKNRGLDLNNDGKITKAEASFKVEQQLAAGLEPQNLA